MTGWRLGYAAGPASSSEMTKLQQNRSCALPAGPVRAWPPWTPTITARDDYRRKRDLVLQHPRHFEIDPPGGFLLLPQGPERFPPRRLRRRPSATTC